MNRDDVKSVLLLYRPGTADGEDPEIAEALALAERDPELKDWLRGHCERQSAARMKFRAIGAPAGLKEQIISEQAAMERMKRWRKKAAVAVVAALALVMTLGSLWFSRRTPDDTLAIYQNQMAGVALRGYAMDVVTNDLEAIRAYLTQNRAPAEFIIPASLQKATLTGCAVEDWHDAKVSMICFRTGQASSDVASDLWLFVVDRNLVRKSSAGTTPQLSHVNRMMTATWIQGDKLYFLGTTADAQTLQHYL